jgi:sarcosine oxidase subunit beta
MSLAYELWPRLVAELDVETAYERTGHLLLYERRTGGLDGGYESATTRARVQSDFGIESEVLTGAEVGELEPHVSDEVVGALYCPNDGVADHTAVTRRLARGAETHGATVHERTPVCGLERTDGRVTAVVTAADRFEVDDTVLLLSNTHVPELVESEFGLTLPVWETFPQVSTTEPLDEVPVNHLVGHDHRRLALKAVSGDRVMISGGWRGERDERTGRGVAVPERVRGNADDARAVFPPLEGVTIDDADASRRDTVSVDGIPIVDSLPGADNVFAATGWTGHGFAIAPAVNRLLATWAVEGERPARLAPFGLDRFSAPPASSSLPPPG